ncbi:MAG: peptidoglycan-binding protein [Granulosicoccus sp.]
MPYFILKSVLAIAIVLAAVFPARTFAQSVDDCMTANQTEALTLCKLILDNGSRNSDVYWKLASAQFQEGQQILANRTLNDALRLHPGNAKLLALEKIITTAATEQERIARSAKLNQRSLDQGALKISCLIKTGEEAITACKRRMELTDDDGDRMRARLAELESEQSKTTVATAPAVEIPQPERRPEPNPPVSPTPAIKPADTSRETNIAALPPVSDTQENDPLAEAQETARLTAEARREAYKKLVADVQTRLNGLGYPAGIPDGVPGSKTRAALRNFYTAIGAPVITSISDITLEDLIVEQSKLVSARQFLRQSELALEQGNGEVAEQKLAEAKLSSRLLDVPADLERAIQGLQVGTSAAAEAIQETQNDQLPVIATTDNKESQRFADLMDQISILYEQIKRNERRQSQRLNQLRDIL